MKQKHLILMFLAVWLGMFTMISGTVLISSTGDGGFETGNTYPLNNWTVVNGANNTMTVGNIPTTYAGSNCAYSWNGTAWSGTANASVNHFYRDVTFPAGESIIQLSFYYKVVNVDATYDFLKVWMVPTSTTPVAGTQLSSTQIGATYDSATSWTLVTVTIPSSYTGTTSRLVFSWKTDSYSPYAAVAIDNISLTSETPPPALSGTKTIDPSGSGANNYTTFTAAINALNSAGVASGGVTFNVADGAMFTEEPPVITATGSVSSPIVFQKAGSGANPTIYVTTSSAGIQISGGDYITFDGINIAINTGSTPIYGYYLVAASGGTNGAQYNTIKNCSITLNKTNTSSKGIYQYYYATPTNISGTNSYNKYQNISIANSAAGVYLSGYYSATYADVGCEISNCTIGGASANDMGGSTTAYGVYAYYQSGLKMFSNTIRNITTSSSYSSAYGIYLYTCYGENLIHSNKIYDVKVSVSSSSTIYGIYASLGSTLTNSAKIYNNMIWGISSAYTGTNSTSYAVEGIYLAGSGASNTYYVDFNSIGIAGPTTAQSAGVYLAAVTAKHLLRNNIIANYTGAQTSTTKHYCIYSPNATTIGITGSVSNNNVLYVDNATNGYIARGSSTDYATITAWNTATVLSSIYCRIQPFQFDS